MMVGGFHFRVVIMEKLQLNCALIAQHERELQGECVSFTLFLCYFRLTFFLLVLRPILTFNYEPVHYPVRNCKFVCYEIMQSEYFHFFLIFSSSKKVCKPKSFQNFHRILHGMQHRLTSSLKRILIDVVLELRKVVLK